MEFTVSIQIVKQYLLLFDVILLLLKHGMGINYDLAISFVIVKWLLENKGKKTQKYSYLEKHINIISFWSKIKFKVLV